MHIWTYRPSTALILSHIKQADAMHKYILNKPNNMSQSFNLFTLGKINNFRKEQLRVRKYICSCLKTNARSWMQEEEHAYRSYRCIRQGDHIKLKSLQKKIPCLSPIITQSTIAFNCTDNKRNTNLNMNKKGTHAWDQLQCRV